MEKKYRKVRSVILIIMALLLISAGVMVFFSPYGAAEGFPYKLVRNSVEINAPVEKVYQFLGNSGNASRWSIFVHHISTLNKDSFPDGSVGSRRRCFCQPDEQGVWWDELITIVNSNVKRQLTIYNLNGFAMTAEHLATEQLYESLGENKTKLTFTFFVKDAQPTWWEQAKIYFSAYRMKTIFEGNMDNIKRLVEAERNG